MMTKNQSFGGGCGNTPSVYADRLRDLARAVRRIGDGYRTNPEAIAIQKDSIATDLARLARAMERL